ncbi:unnamed protein product [Cuscuta europaea]|uniref:Uncharacterized protein n=1 Tax=Cuscuta europaea TaxID=41803 RepID=A0A9P0ZVP8_CUSEU|nr:unnamed protein product [Cuscuta europaea]
MVTYSYQTGVWAAAEATVIASTGEYIPIATSMFIKSSMLRFLPQCSSPLSFLRALQKRISHYNNLFNRNHFIIRHTPILNLPDTPATPETFATIHLSFPKPPRPAGMK